MRCDFGLTQLESGFILLAHARRSPATPSPPWRPPPLWPGAMFARLFSSRRGPSKAEQDFTLKRKYDLVFAIGERDWAAACRALQNDRAKARLKDADGYLPMHLALANRGSERLLMLLIDAYPGALLERDPAGRLPFHIVCRDPTCLLSFVQFLLKAEPKVLGEKDPNGDLPLHMSIRHRCPAETTLLLLESHPAAAAAKDKDGNLPLHLCLRFRGIGDLKQQHKVFFALVDANPDAVRARNAKKDLPLHRAALFNLDLVILKTLAERYPESLFEPDSQGNLPIHLYFMQMRGGRPCDDLLHFFLEANPSSLGAKNKAKCTPLQVLEKFHEQIDKYTY